MVRAMGVRVAVAALGVAWLAVDGARAQGSDQARADQFVRGIYAEEAHGSPRPERIYDRGLLALMKRDQAAGMPVLRADPLCECQDSDGLKLQSVTVGPTEAGKADAVVTFTLGGQGHTVRLQLVDADGGWRIYDVLGPPGQSLRQMLSAGATRRTRH